MPGPNPVFIPGPTNIPEVLRKACDMPTIDHRSPAFREILEPARAGVAQVIGMDEGEVVIFPSSGTGGWESALSNTLSAGDKILVARFGMFSHRWIDMCQRFGLDVHVIDVPWGQGVPVEQMGAVLAADSGHQIKAVLATHNETATGVKSDIAGLRGAMDACDHPALLMVDGVSSVGSFEFRMLPRTYFDYRDMIKSYVSGGYPYTPLVGMLNGLATSCKMLLDEGLDAVYARHARIAEGVRRAVVAWGMTPCAVSPELYSNSVTAVVVPEGFDATDVVTLAAEKYDVAFGVGLGEVAGKVFRIGHLGLLTDVQALSGLATAEMCMADLGYPITLGSGVAAAQDYFRNTTSGAAALAAE